MLRNKVSFCCLQNNSNRLQFSVQIRKRIYLLMVWNEDKKILCKHNADTRPVASKKGNKASKP
ncbi:CLUMA_CG001771, isoform A [Clunio marinus]|uniref:CLUMA_CG001771, isoform A n=1 Tax=Clunio marinus TaxID=568069 RepID=A0A1J1HP37_9DIPT|nr:CLUMA_CG001771, isoform A [Clunio marinus]